MQKIAMALFSPWLFHIKAIHVQKLSIHVISIDFKSVVCLNILMFSDIYKLSFILLSEGDVFT